MWEQRRRGDQKAKSKRSIPRLARAEARMADEIDAGQERGEVATPEKHPQGLVQDPDRPPATFKPSASTAAVSVTVRLHPMTGVTPRQLDALRQALFLLTGT